MEVASRSMHVKDKSFLAIVYIHLPFLTESFLKGFASLYDNKRRKATTKKNTFRETNSLSQLCTSSVHHSIRMFRVEYV